MSIVCGCKWRKNKNMMMKVKDSPCMVDIILYSSTCGRKMVVREWLYSHTLKLSSIIKRMRTYSLVVYSDYPSINSEYHPQIPMSAHATATHSKGVKEEIHKNTHLCLLSCRANIYSYTTLRSVWHDLWFKIT